MRLFIVLNFILKAKFGLTLFFNSSNSCSEGSNCDNACNATNSISTCISPINVNQSIVIKSIITSVQISHLDTNDLTVELIAPDGTKAILSFGPNNNGITRVYRIDSIIGKNASGLWKLSVIDNGGGWKTTGIQWSLKINSITQTNIYNLSDSLTIDLLLSDQDVTPCLLNCSNHGQCILTDTDMYICQCSQHYTGDRCHIDKRFCSSRPCLFNSTCTDFIDNQGKYSFNCSCPLNYYGTYCEKQVDVCVNETCSNNGVCKKKDSVAICDCFKMYSGEKCQIESSEMKAIKTTIRFASILAILILFGFYLLFVLVDICNFYGFRRKMLLKKHKRSKNKTDIIQFVYKN